MHRKAFWKSLQIDASENGKFSFDILNKGFQGIEENLAKGATTGGANWRQRWREEWQALGREMEASTLKFSMNKAFEGIFKEAGGSSVGKLAASLFGSGNKEAPPSSDLGKVLPSIGGGIGTAGFGTSGLAAPTLQMAGTTLSTAGTMLTTAATGLSAAAATLGAGSAASGSGGAASILDLIPHAGGGDVTPGQGYLVGEKGPEAFMPTSEGSIVPHDSLKGGGETHNHYYDLRGADPAAVARLERALPMIEDRAVARAQSMQRETSLRKRPG